MASNDFHSFLRGIGVDPRVVANAMASVRAGYPSKRHAAQRRRKRK